MRGSASSPSCAAWPTTPTIVIHVESGTELQVANHGDEELVLYIYGAPPETGGAEFLDSAV